MKATTFGILTVSDTAFRNINEDKAGPRLQLEIEKYFPDCTILKKIVPDGVINIKEILKLWVKSECNVIFTVGGTGFSPRDVTPEATRDVIQREAPGIAYAMITKSLAITDMAMLSRAVCGISDQSLIVNLPGSTKAAVECFGFVRPAIPHAVALLTGNKELIAITHKWVQQVPESAQSQTSLQTSLIANSENSRESKVKMDNVANRNRKSPYPMIEVETAFNTIIEESRPVLEKEEIEFSKAINRILAEDVYAENPVPPFRASIKDGYAVRSSDGLGERIVRDVTAAGDKPSDEILKEGEAIRISTGAPIPPGADAVVQVEDTTLIEKSIDGSQELKIVINVAPEAGHDIREIGSDIAAGQLVLPKFERISPAYIGVLAMLGKIKVKVFKRTSVGIVSTGNELKAPNEELKPGNIYDSNKYALLHLLKRYSYDSNDCGTAKDNPDSLKSALERALASNNIIITTGGVSMGEFDLVREVLETDFDATIHFARVNMKPGKPTTFATLSYGGQFKMIFALPGNPVSCCVTCLLYVIPTLKYMERSRIYKFPIIRLRDTCDLKNLDERPEYHRIIVTADADGTLKATSTGKQISSRLNSLAGANGLAIVLKTVPSVVQSNTSYLHANIFSSLSSSPVQPPVQPKHFNVVLFDDIQ